TVLLVTVAARPVTEQELDEAAAHVVGGDAHWSGSRGGRLTRVDHSGFGGRRAIDCRGLVDTCAQAGGAAKQRNHGMSEHRRTLYWFRLKRSRARISAPAMAN